LWDVALYYIMENIKAFGRAAPYYIFHRTIIKVTDIISNILPESIRGWKVGRELAKYSLRPT